MAYWCTILNFTLWLHLAWCLDKDFFQHKSCFNFPTGLSKACPKVSKQLKSDQWCWNMVGRTRILLILVLLPFLIHISSFLTSLLHKYLLMILKVIEEVKNTDHMAMFREHFYCFLRYEVSLCYTNQNIQSIPIHIWSLDSVEIQMHQICWYWRN